MSLSYTWMTKFTKFVAEKIQYNFEKVNQFEYLVVFITHMVQESGNIEKRIFKNSKTTGALTSILKAKKIYLE